MEDKFVWILLLQKERLSVLRDREVEERGLVSGKGRNILHQLICGLVTYLSTPQRKHSSPLLRNMEPLLPAC
jgi:hypothetical protein